MKKTIKTKLQKSRSRILLIIFILLLGYHYVVPYAFFVFYQPKEGDIVFQSLPNASDLVKAIEGVSNSPFSHCGIIIKKDNKWFVNEAIMDVHSTPLFSFIARGRGKRFAIYRLTEQYCKWRGKSAAHDDSIVRHFPTQNTNPTQKCAQSALTRFKLPYPKNLQT